MLEYSNYLENKHVNHYLTEITEKKIASVLNIIILANIL